MVDSPLAYTFLIGVSTLFPEVLASPSPRSDPVRLRKLRDGPIEPCARVAEDGAQLLVVSLADPLDAPEAVRQLMADLDISAMVFDRNKYEAFETIANESHWTAAATARAAAEIAGWMLPELSAREWVKLKVPSPALTQDQLP